MITPSKERTEHFQPKILRRRFHQKQHDLPHSLRKEGTDHRKLQFNIKKRYQVKEGTDRQKLNLNTHNLRKEGISPWTLQSSKSHLISVKRNQMALILCFQGENMPQDQQNEKGAIRKWIVPFYLYALLPYLSNKSHTAQ